MLASPPVSHEASRARYPDETGYVERDGVRVFYEAYGTGEPTILLLPTWSIVQSRLWKLQVPYLARHFRVLTFDGRGNGRSDRPTTPEAYADAEFAADALAVLDATGTGSAVLVSLSGGAAWALLLATDHPDRVRAAVFLAPALGLAPPDPARAAGRDTFADELSSYEGWDKYNRHYWRREYRDFLDFFFAECLSEPHSTKPIEDCVGWGLETDPETLILTRDAPRLVRREEILALTAAVRCPVLVIHGSDDHVVGHRHGAALAEHLGGHLLTFEGGGHIVCARDPVRVNLGIRAFVDALPASGVP